MTGGAVISGLGDGLFLGVLVASVGCGGLWVGTTLEGVEVAGFELAQLAASSRVAMPGATRDTRGRTPA